MTEQEWLASSDPAAMLQHLERWNPGSGEPFVRSHPIYYSGRKLRLFAEVAGCAVCRDRYRNDSAWAYAAYVCTATCGFGLCGKQAALLRDIVGNPFRPVRLRLGERTAACSACDGYGMTGEYRQSKCEWCDGDGLQAAPCPWLTPTVCTLAQAAYDECQDDGTLDPDRLAILSDALEEAGCEDETILRHLRGEEYDPVQSVMSTKGRTTIGGSWRLLPGPHVRGCWVIDLLLGRE